MTQKHITTVNKKYTTNQICEASELTVKSDTEFSLNVITWLSSPI